MPNFGQVVRMSREKRGESKKALATYLKISEGFVKHLESSRTVPVSPRIVGALARHYRLPKAKLERLAARRNVVARAYYRNYRKTG